MYLHHLLLYIIYKILVNYYTYTLSLPIKNTTNICKECLLSYKYNGKKKNREIGAGDDNLVSTYSKYFRRYNIKSTHIRVFSHNVTTLYYIKILLKDRECYVGRTLCGR